MSIIAARTATVDIYGGDYLDRIRHLERQFDAALKEESDAPRMNHEELRSEELLAEHAALVAEAEETAVHIVLRALRRSEWRALTAEFPPREDHAGDEAVGFDQSRIADALVPLSIVSPALDEDDLDMLSEADFSRLYVTAVSLNRLPGGSPKVLTRPDSQASTGSGATSS